MTNDHTLPPLVLTGFLLALIFIAMEAFAGFGSRWGWWNFMIGIGMLRWAAYGGLCAAVVNAVGFAVSSFHHRVFASAALSIAGIIIGLSAAGIPWTWMQAAKQVPPIHDITTDTTNPPEFKAILALRKNAPNSASYGGEEIAAEQRKAYPDIRPLVMPVSARVAFEKALTVARRMGWEIVAMVPSEGRIEAVDSTFWFGFKDDIVIRILAEGEGSRVDIRSESRVGVSDIGTNAKRIRTFLEKMQS